MERSNTDEFEIVMGASDWKAYNTQVSAIIMEFNEEHIRGKAKGQGMLNYIPLGNVFTLEVEMPYGFPAVRPIVRLSEPDFKTVTQKHLDNEGFIVHPGLLSWKHPEPLSEVLRKIFTDLSSDPPRPKIKWGFGAASTPDLRAPSAPTEATQPTPSKPKINWGFGSVSAKEVRMDVRTTDVKACKVAEAPPIPALSVPLPSSSKNVFKPSPVPVEIHKKPVEEVALPSVPDVPRSFPSVQKLSVRELQKISSEGLDTATLRNLSEGFFTSSDNVTEKAVLKSQANSQKLAEAEDDLQLSRTKVFDLRAKLASLKEELDVVSLCKADVIESRNSNVHLTAIRTEAQDNLRAAQAQFEKSREPLAYLNSAFFPLAAEYHKVMLSIGSSQ
eukprot:TRINITY_DN7541_c0_g1_i1.p1 TRINITY_DN7541_c0_g1~~TRINITY_DN7541_c0_g1_i1.p1  ORF type:complete len:402 (+),score=59.77 TRINITY_DN7541_c0_g1_i1:48-1208(+)